MDNENDPIRNTLSLKPSAHWIKVFHSNSNCTTIFYPSLNIFVCTFTLSLHVKSSDLSASCKKYEIIRICIKHALGMRLIIVINPRPHMGGGGGCHPQVGFVPCTPVFEAGDLIFAIAAF